MPYKRKGKTVYSKSGGKWHKKQTATSVANAKKTMRLLYGIEGGMTPRKSTRRKRR